MTIESLYKKSKSLKQFKNLLIAKVDIDNRLYTEVMGIDPLEFEPAARKIIAEVKAIIDVPLSDDENALIEKIETRHGE